MERICFIATLRPGSEDEYKVRHDEIWPEMEAALRESGWTNYSIFRRGRTIVGYAECHPSVEESMAAIEGNETNARWSRYVADLFSEARDDSGGLLLADEVWHLSERPSTESPPDPTPS